MRRSSWQRPLGQLNQHQCFPFFWLDVGDADQVGARSHVDGEVLLVISGSVYPAAGRLATLTNPGSRLAWSRAIPHHVAICGSCDDGTVTTSKTLILWDVDHTLIENGGVSKETYALAFELLVGTPPAARPQTDGRTDRSIMAELFAANGVAMTEAHRDALFPTLIEAMKRNADALRLRGHALAGADAALTAVSRDGSFVQSVLTGNIPENAFTKLATFGLHKHLDFEVGGFGSDSIVRADLVAASQAKAGSKYATLFDRGNTILVGDTTRDVEAGVKGGARVLAVATGVDAVEVLRTAGADLVLKDLADTESVLRCLREIASAGAQGS
ncbi:HAD hydrolase-like protein [Micromonospora purpureochromogenes]|uniref:HAD family hydrolase n=1 Tax=Micromonospora purpureochromogenes TaxID=47872 RepID=UPI00340A76C3